MVQETKIGYNIRQCWLADIEQLTTGERAEVMNALIAFNLGRDYKFQSRVADMLWRNMKRTFEIDLDRNGALSLIRSESGKKGGRKPRLPRDERYPNKRPRRRRDEISDEESPDELPDESPDEIDNSNDDLNAQNVQNVQNAENPLLKANAFDSDIVNIVQMENGAKMAIIDENAPETELLKLVENMELKREYSALSDMPTPERKQMLFLLLRTKIEMCLNGENPQNPLKENINNNININNNSLSLNPSLPANGERGKPDALKSGVGEGEGLAATKSPPTLSAWETYAEKINWKSKIEIKSSFDYYESTKWKRGNTKIIDWKAVCRNAKLYADRRANRIPDQTFELLDATRQPKYWKVEYSNAHHRCPADIDFTWGDFVMSNPDEALDVLKRCLAYPENRKMFGV